MFGIFEIVNGRKVRVFPNRTFKTVIAAIASMGSNVVHYEIEPDSSAGDVFNSNGCVYAIEKV